MVDIIMVTETTIQTSAPPLENIQMKFSCEVKS